LLADREALSLVVIHAFASGCAVGEDGPYALAALEQLEIALVGEHHALWASVCANDDRLRVDPGSAKLREERWQLLPSLARREHLMRLALHDFILADVYMFRYTIDTSILIRHLTGDPPGQARRATRFLTRAEELLLTDLVAAEVVYVLESF
jgi:hypothetical protein